MRRDPPRFGFGQSISPSFVNRRSWSCSFAGGCRRFGGFHPPRRSARSRMTSGSLRLERETRVERDRPPVRVVITGAAGVIGGVLRRGLGDGYVIRGVDRRRTREHDVDRLDVTRLKALDAAFAGADAVIDLASSA